MTRRVDTSKHTITVMDGTEVAGTLVERCGEFIAFDIAGKKLGTFKTLIEAARRA